MSPTPRLLRDRGLTALALVLAAYLVVYLAPVLSPAGMELFATHAGETALLALAVVVLFSGARSVGHLEERRFWLFLALGFSCWTAGALVRLLWRDPSHDLWAPLAVASLYLLSYLACVLAVDQRPHLESGWSRRDPTYAFSTLGSLLFVFALVVYLFILPSGSASGSFPRLVTTRYLFIALDGLLLLRFGQLALVCRDGAWRRTYVLLASASAFWTVTDSINLLIEKALIVLPIGSVWDWLWYAPPVLVILARRMRENAPRRRDTQPSFPAAADDASRTDATILLLIYAFLFPAVHLGLNTLRVVPEPNRELREALVLVSLTAFVGLAVGQYRMLEKRNRDLRNTITVLATNEQMQQAQKMEAIGRLAGGVAHDFNNLLTVIRGHTELLLESHGKDRATHRNLEEINSASERAGWLTGQLLAFSRSQVLRPRAVHVNRVVSEATTMLRRLLGERVALEAALDPDIGPILVDPGQFLQVLLNLAVNARDAMPRGGVLAFRTSECWLRPGDPDLPPDAEPGRYVVLSARDDGEGIDENTQARIFEPFFTTKQGGTGLGLATVYGIVRQSGGFVRVISEPGRGAVFVLFFPRVEEPPALEPESLSRQGIPVPTLRRVLLAEDDATVRLTVRQMLEASGYEVVDVENGEVALAAFEAEGGRFDVLVSDVVMTGLSGRDLARTLRERRSDLRVLFISGYARDEHEAGIRVGDDDAFLQKPFSLRSLQESLAALR